MLEARYAQPPTIDASEFWTLTSIYGLCSMMEAETVEFRSQYPSFLVLHMPQLNDLWISNLALWITRFPKSTELISLFRNSRRKS